MSIDQLQEYGLETMDDDEVSRFLAAEKSGVLGLPAEGSPYMVPLSYAYDGDWTLYFTYLLGPSSEKEQLTAQTGRGRFLVYNVETLFNWRSVMVEGPLTEMPESEWDEIEHLLESVWRPEILKTAAMNGSVKIYQLSAENRSGVKHTGLAPGFKEGIEQESGPNES